VALKNIGKKILWSLLIVLVLIFTFLATAIAPIDFTPLAQLSEVQQTYQNINNVKFNSSEPKSIIKAGWSTTNITPKNPIQMAGYGPRGPYNFVHDSLYSRAIVFDNGINELVIITLDLLLFPGIIKDALQDSLSAKGFSPDEIFLNATHTHNGFGNWEKSLAGKVVFGQFNQQNVDYLIRQVLKSVTIARKNKSAVRIGFDKIDANELVANRLDQEKGIIDPFLRVISLKKENGVKAIITSFSGHPVNLDADIWEISRDYPGILVDELEKEDAIEFAMFCAGMVASHNIDINIPKGHERIQKVGKLLSEKIKNNLDSIDYNEFSNLGGLDMEINMPPSQMRITNGLHVRDWLFSTVLGPLRANIKVLEIGDLLLVGMPCDYSGELSINNGLDQIATDRGKHLFITSFNGNYVGYITEDGHYAACNHDEVKSMNWVGPYKGTYFTEIIKRTIWKATD
jgi:neutral ceramidase